MALNVLSVLFWKQITFKMHEASVRVIIVIEVIFKLPILGPTFFLTTALLPNLEISD